MGYYLNMWVRILSFVVKVDERFRIILPRELRKPFPISVSEKFYVIASGDMLLLKKTRLDPSSELDKLLGDLKFSREARRKAEEWLLRKMEEKS